MAKRHGGVPGGGGMPNNMNNMMKQAQKMQKDMLEMQEQLDTMLFEATAGGGAVKAEVHILLS
jgi:DNA-binding protein YbaB